MIICCKACKFHDKIKTPVISMHRLSEAFQSNGFVLFGHHDSHHKVISIGLASQWERDFNGSICFGF
jgi:hypothetical protein